MNTNRPVLESGFVALLAGNIAEVTGRNNNSDFVRSHSIASGSASDDSFKVPRASRGRCIYRPRRSIMQDFFGSHASVRRNRAHTRRRW
jgi:hypothetical protein